MLLLRLDAHFYLSWVWISVLSIYYPPSANSPTASKLVYKFNYAKRSAFFTPIPTFPKIRKCTDLGGRRQKKLFSSPILGFKNGRFLRAQPGGAGGGKGLE
jgi:hypothetical protein